MEPNEVLPKVSWDAGTAYDLFVSLAVLHKPDRFGLRASWAAGVRSRLGSEERDTLEQAEMLFPAPLQWVYGLPQPRDASSVLWALRQVPAAERLSVLGLHPGLVPQLTAVLKRVAASQAWEATDLEILRDAIRRERNETLRPKALAGLLDTWAQPQEFGERYLAALQAYYQVFFSEEEQRIIPVLQQGLSQASDLAKEKELPELFEQLSQGVSIPDLMQRTELVFVASYWSTPLVFIRKLDERRTLLTFGVRPGENSLVPGDLVPDALLQALKALGDPTRLRILRYLAQEPLTPAELARRLRLRAPTMTHHLSALRLAGLVHITLEDNDKKRYTTRWETIDGLQKHLQDFFVSGSDGASE